MSFSTEIKKVDWRRANQYDRVISLECLLPWKMGSQSNIFQKSLAQRSTTIIYSGSFTPFTCVQFTMKSARHATHDLLRVLPVFIRFFPLPLDFYHSFLRTVIKLITQFEQNAWANILQHDVKWLLQSSNMRAKNRGTKKRFTQLLVIGAHLSSTPNNFVTNSFVLLFPKRTCIFHWHHNDHIIKYARLSHILTTNIP